MAKRELEGTDPQEFSQRMVFEDEDEGTSLAKSFCRKSARSWAKLQMMIAEQSTAMVSILLGMGSPGRPTSSPPWREANLHTFLPKIQRHRRWMPIASNSAKMLPSPLF